MKWLKAGIVGIIAALVMFLLLAVAIHVTGMAPFNQAPSAAFLDKLGFPTQPWALIVHFAYGIFWSIVLVAVFGSRTNIWNGMGLSVALWLIFMIAYSPIIGWGFFGVGGPGHELPSDDPLYLGSPVMFIVAALLVHLVYGAIIGWLNPLWIRQTGQQKQAAANEQNAPTGQTAQQGR